MENIKKGEDKQVTITITSGGAAFDLTGHTVVVVITSNESSIIGRFASTTPFTDAQNNSYSPLTITDAENGIIDLLLTNQMTTDADVGVVYAYVKIRETATNKYTEAEPIKIAKITPTPATAVTDF